MGAAIQMARQGRCVRCGPGAHLRRDMVTGPGFRSLNQPGAASAAIGRRRGSRVNPVEATVPPITGPIWHAIVYFGAASVVSNRPIPLKTVKTADKESCAGILIQALSH